MFCYSGPDYSLWIYTLPSPDSLLSVCTSDQTMHMIMHYNFYGFWDLLCLSNISSYMGLWHELILLCKPGSFDNGFVLCLLFWNFMKKYINFSMIKIWLFPLKLFIYHSLGRLSHSFPLPCRFTIRLALLSIWLARDEITQYAYSRWDPDLYDWD